MSLLAERPERYVLCVDDDLDFLKSMEVFLPDMINAGPDATVVYHFLFLSDPGQALETITELIAENATVAMIISDQQMPSMKGTEFLTATRGVLADSIRILLTGHAGIEAAIAAINEHLLDRYLTKPIEDPHDFTLNVRQLLQRFEMGRLIETQSAALQCLYEFANRINGMADLPSMIEYVASFTRGVLHCDRVHVEAPDAGDASEDASRHATAEVVAVASGTEPASAAGAARAPACDRLDLDGEMPAGLRPIVERIGLRAGMAAAYVRLHTRESDLGVVIAAREAHRTFADHELQTLGYIADTASTAIEKQRTWLRLENAYRIAKQQAAHLAEANEKLLLLDRMKAEFLTFISHELRTPLNHIAAIAMLDDGFSPQERLVVTEAVRSGYERLHRLIVRGLEYFDWCGRERIHTRETTDLGTSVRAVVTSFQQKKECHVEWDLALMQQPCVGQIPPVQFEDIVRVLLENALKFSTGVPHVRIETSLNHGDVTLRVADRGRGFPPEVAARIFDPFTVMQMNNHSAGTALNLARIRAVLGVYGGTASAESRGPGRGATFTIQIPAATRGGQQDG